MDQFARGKKALQASNFDEAIKEFTAALKQSPTSPDYLIQRAAAYGRAQHHTAALEDAEKAVVNAQKRAKRELIVQAQLRRGISLWQLGRYGDAKFVLDIVKRMDEKEKQVPMWLQKTELKLKACDEEAKKVAVTEMPDVDGAASTTGSANGNSTSSANGASHANPASSAPAQPATIQQTPPDKIRHEWYQNTQNIYFTLLAKGVPKDKCQFDITERSLSISYPTSTGSDYSLHLEPLFGEVKPKECIPRVMSTKLEVVLVKATPGQKWSALESSEPVDSATEAAAGSTDDKNGEAVKRAVFTNSAPKGPAYPTSSKSGPKDWDKAAKEALNAEKSGKEGDINDDEDYEGGDEANHFFKKLFKGASPETQRAMMKSYTESNGTALSTNWEEVSKGPVETVPPDGMEARSWKK